MLRKIGIILLSVVFIGSMSWALTVSTVDAEAKCECGKDCKCEHCATGKGECHCKDGDKGCKCKSDGKGCQCGEDCKCEH